MNKRMLIVMVVASAIVVMTVETAFAKGPESATLIGPDIDQPIELTQSHPAIGQLMQQSGIWFETDQRLPGEPAGDLGPVYTLTWINSGPPEASVEERSIRQLLYPLAENGPLIHTPAQVGLVGWGGEVLGWFEAPESLMDTLVGLGAPVPTSPPTNDLQAPDAAATAAPVDLDAAIPNDAADIVSVENEPDYFVYLALGGFGLFVALVWAARRRQSV